MATRSTFYEAAASRTQGRLRSPTRSVSAGAIAALLLFAATLLLRSGRFGDPNIEPDETFTLNLSSPSGASIAKSPFGKGVLIALKGAERGCIPGSGQPSCPEPIKWTLRRRPLVVNLPAQ